MEHSSTERIPSRLPVAPRCRIATIATLGLLLLLARGASAATPTEEVRSFLARAISIVEDVALSPMERLDAVRGMLAHVFDFRGAAELALGPYWRARTPAERREFVPLFADLLERSYLSQVQSRMKRDGGVKITYLDESRDGDRATVRTILSPDGREDVPFDYRLVRRGDRWLVRDVVIEGVSLVENYRAQFVKTIESSSYHQLVAWLKAKASEGPRTPEARAGSLASLTTPPGFRREAALTDVPFGADGAAIGGAATKILDKNAAWLRAHDGARVLVEGRADERGTAEANLALGDRRARSVKAYLVARGVEASRITIVSRGEKDPVCLDHTKACWAKNRRARLLVGE
ncbi:MAG TPA: ABC transporter substrate-binding protein [Methylomirabilota bacterium]|nr:ABC transporter substrate-binding protein [Methylomirabilota bacterium]